MRLPVLPIPPRARDNFLGSRGYARHRLNGLQRILADSGLTGEHHRIRAIKDGVRNVARFCARGARLRRHRVQHLRGHNHRLARVPRLGEYTALQHWHRFWRRLHAEIPARDHDGVGGCHHGGKIGDRLELLDLGDDRNVAVGHQRSQRMHVLGSSHERLAEEVDVGGERPLDNRSIEAGDRVDTQRDAGCVDALVRQQRPADFDARVHLTPGHLGDDQFDAAVVKQ